MGFYISISLAAGKRSAPARVVVYQNVRTNDYEFSCEQLRISKRFGAARLA